MTKIPTHTADAVLALRNLVLEICRVRDDGRELLETVSSGGLRILLDENRGLLAIGIARDARVDWLETIRCDPQNELDFGLVCSTVTPAVTH